MTSCSVLWLNKAFQVSVLINSKGVWKDQTDYFMGFFFFFTGCGVRERQRRQASLQDPEHQRQHHPHCDGGPLPPSRQPRSAAGLRGSVSGSEANRAAAALPAPPVRPGGFRQRR